jgi:solute carrier family 25 phosphate transporter 3
MPTVLAYFSQSGTKYAMYELIKDNMSGALGPEQAAQYKSLVYIVSAGSAEAIADVFMCPWEMLKVKVQTSQSGSFPSQFRPALTSMIQQRSNLNFPFGSLTPLWSRQVIGTVANFVTFEHTVNAIYEHLLTKNKDEYGKSTQLGVSFAAGYVSGIVSTIVSHPADSLLSLRARYPDKSYRQIIDLVGWQQLATQGLIPRAALTGTIIASQWFLYDSFKTMLGLGTSGGGSLGDNPKRIDDAVVASATQKLWKTESATA